MEIIFFLQLKKCVRDLIDHLSKRKRNDKKVALKTNCFQNQKSGVGGNRTRVQTSHNQAFFRLSFFVCFSRDQ